MHRKYFYTILGLTAFSLFLITIFFLKQRPAHQSQESIQTRQAPFKTYINGVGVVEPKSGNIYLGIPFDRIVKKVNVAVNDHVKKGDILVELEHGDLTANLLIKQSEYEKALANLKKLKALPRKEDLIIAEEALRKAQIAFNESKTTYEMTLHLPTPNAISKEERDRRLYKYQQMEAVVKELKARYEKIKSGIWEPDLKIALLQVEQANADIKAIKAEIERTQIKSPIDGTILQIKIHEGETPSSDPSHTTLIVGDVNELYLRVSIDQFNVANVSPEASAVAYRQGNHSIVFPLEFVHAEPFMIPKKYLTNAVDEQIDTQVFEILYRIAQKDSSLLIGEQMDVFIDNTK